MLAYTRRAYDVVAKPEINFHTHTRRRHTNTFIGVVSHTLKFVRASGIADGTSIQCLFLLLSFSSLVSSRSFCSNLREFCSWLFPRRILKNRNGMCVLTKLNVYGYGFLACVALWVWKTKTKKGKNENENNRPKTNLGKTSTCYVLMRGELWVSKVFRDFDKCFYFSLDKNFIHILKDLSHTSCLITLKASEDFFYKNFFLLLTLHCL